MKYQPISCSLYDTIESYAVSKKNVEVIYSDEAERKTISGKIEDIFSKEKSEYLRIGKIEIRLDQIKTINEKMDVA
jgi:transcriptional antiterminator Rof (Rho-off)